MKSKNKKKLARTTVPTTAIGRASRLFAAGAVFIGREMAVRSLDAISALSEDSKIRKRLEQAKGLVDALSQLKGAAMKTGQLLSLEFSDLLPPEVTEILRSLHDSSSFMPFNQVEKILKKELGSQLFLDLKNISSEPVSSASIGQVHSAQLKGKKVAIKIQFPGVDRSISADLALVRKALESILWIQNKNVPLDGFFEECERVLKQEVDYTKEAQFIKKFSTYVDGSKFFELPEVYENYSTKRVLTLSFMDGERLGQWMKKPMTVEEKMTFAERILELIYSEFFVWGIVQTDPNFGNFLYRPKEKKLVLLDFGACNLYEETLRINIIRLLKAAMNGSATEILDIAHQIGVLDPREDETTKRLFVRMMGLIIDVYRAEKQPFNFASIEYLTNIRSTTFEFAKLVKHTEPARDLIFLNRKLGGMFHLLKDLEVRYDLSQFWTRMTRP